MAISREDWKKTLEEVVQEITATAHFDDVYWQVNAIIAGNPEINKSNVFLDWLMFTYVDSIIVRLRRFADKNKKTVSLWRLLEDLKKVQPALASKKEINAKQKELRNALSRVEDYANTLIAHKVNISQKVELTFQDVRRALASAFRVFSWCASLTNAHWVTAVPVIQENWLAIFNVPWLKEGFPPSYIHLDALLEEIEKNDGN